MADERPRKSSPDKASSADVALRNAWRRIEAEPLPPAIARLINNPGAKPRRDPRS